MKRQARRLKVFLQSAMVLSVVGFCSVSQAAIVVELKVGPAEDELLVETRGSCTGPGKPNENGCVHVSGKEVINFNLTGIKVCSEAPGAKWVLDKVVLSEGKGSAPGISQQASDDFGADMATGVVTDVINPSPSHIGVRDDNTAEYDIWYTVIARCDGGMSTIEIDPRVENDGTGTH